LTANRLTFSGPFVTAVGGTTGIDPETAIFFTGGGFSNYFTRPSYQDQVVTTYIKKLNGAYHGLYKYGFCRLVFCELPLNNVADYHTHSTSGRGFPDVAARGDEYRVVIGGETTHIGGTSASSPVRTNPQVKFFMRQTEIFHFGLGCRRISLALERLQNLARPPIARVPQPIFVF